MNRNGNRHLPAAEEGRADQPATPLNTAEPESAVTAPLRTGALISIREIRALFGLGRTAAYELTHRPDFPTPLRLSPRCYRWWPAEVAAFAADLRHQAQPANHGRPARQAAAQEIPELRITGKMRTVRRRKEAS
jgi:predicted DNA-binding transcriptional regulator AlpA